MTFNNTFACWVGWVGSIPPPFTFINTNNPPILSFSFKKCLVYKIMKICQYFSTYFFLITKFHLFDPEKYFFSHDQVCSIAVFKVSATLQEIRDIFCICSICSIFCIWKISGVYKILKFSERLLLLLFFVY